MKKPVKRILFFAEAATLAHVGRCCSLASLLHNSGNYIIALAADDRYDEILGQPKFLRIPLYTIPSDIFLSKLEKGQPIYNVDTLSAYVYEDLKIIEDFSPDFIFGDFRLSLAISSKLKGIPYATLTNAYWSPYADIYYPIPELPLTKIIGVNLAQRLFKVVKPIVFFLHAVAFNKTCKKFGLPPLKYDMREIYTHADYTLYADFEALVPMKPSLPCNHVFLGPLTWSANVKLPSWWDSAPKSNPIVFVTMGSSGNQDLLPLILKSLSQMPLTIICITAKRTFLDSHYPNVFVADYLPAEIAVKKADVVICNGGSPMVYEALLASKQIIGIPTNLDQYLMMDIIEKAKLGQTIRSGKINSKLIQNAVNQALENTNTTQQFNSKRQSSNFLLEKIETLIDREIKSVV